MREKEDDAKLFCGEKTFLKRVSFPHTPFSKNFQRNCFYHINDKSNSNFFIESKNYYFLKHNV